MCGVVTLEERREATACVFVGFPLRRVQKTVPLQPDSGPFLRPCSPVLGSSGTCALSFLPCWFPSGPPLLSACPLGVPFYSDSVLCICFRKVKITFVNTVGRSGHF